jgi:hypothetical protein
MPVTFLDGSMIVVTISEKVASETVAVSSSADKITSFEAIWILSVKV